MSGQRLHVALKVSDINCPLTERFEPLLWMLASLQGFLVHPIPNHTLHMPSNITSDDNFQSSASAHTYLLSLGQYDSTWSRGQASLQVKKSKVSSKKPLTLP